MVSLVERGGQAADRLARPNQDSAVLESGKAGGRGSAEAASGWRSSGDAALAANAGRRAQMSRASDHRRKEGMASDLSDRLRCSRRRRDLRENDPQDSEGGDRCLQVAAEGLRRMAGA